MPQLVRDFQSAAVTAKRAHEHGHELAAARFAKEGIDWRSMPSGEFNQNSAMIQFKTLLSREPEVLRSVVPMRNAESALRGIEVACSLVPTWQQCTISWPPSSGEYGDMIHRVACLDERQPMVRLDPASEIVRDEVGLSNSPLSDSLRGQIGELTTAVRCKPGFSRPLLCCIQTQKNQNGILDLIERLPRTPEVVEMLSRLKSSKGF